MLPVVAPPWLKTARLGLLANQASVTGDFQPVSALIQKAGGRITSLFSPQHGYHAEKQANMIESADGWEASLAVPIFSLYGAVREPTEEMLSHVDVLVVDLQDVGTRVYTYGVTMGLCLEAASRAGIKVVVLDRPNPIGGELLEGNILKEDHRSFVGRYPLPMRHGLTMGELARFIVRESGLSCDLEIIPMKGWKRRDLFPSTGLSWVFPSPNMPTWETALLYPGMVLFEGTNVSEGRGTTIPFQVFGAPFIDQGVLTERLDRSSLDGVVLRPVSFEPVFDKWAGKVCYGWQIHITDWHTFRPYRLALALLKALTETHPDSFHWLPPPYEYEWEKLPIDILLGDGKLRVKMLECTQIEVLEMEWQKDLDAFRQKCDSCYIYS